MENKGITKAQLILKGYLWVNLPIILLIITTWYCLTTFANLGTSTSVLIGTILGWLYWEFAIKKWIAWALRNKIKEEELLKTGKLYLLLWNDKPINEIKNKTK